MESWNHQTRGDSGESAWGRVEPADAPAGRGGGAASDLPSGFTGFHLISVGHLGAEYEAYRAGQPCTVTVLNASLAEEPARRRFADDCRAYRGLDGAPGLAVPQECGFTPSDRPWLRSASVSGYIRVASAAAGRPFPASAVTMIAVRLAAALHAMHDAGLLHLDVRPGNLLIQPDGNPLLARYGVRPM